MPQSSKLFALEAVLGPFHNSPLVRKGGFDVFEGLLEPKTLDLMLSEATSVFATAQVSDVAVSDREETRGGNPARRFLSAPGGSVQDA
jgi:hypothetical protein